MILPEKARLGGLVRAVGEELPRLRSRHFTVAGHGLEIRGHTVVLDNKSVILPPAPMAVLRALAEQPGAVLTREELADCLPGHESGRHAVEMAVTRLRSLLRVAGIVQTVVKRGYRFSPDLP